MCSDNGSSPPTRRGCRNDPTPRELQVLWGVWRGLTNREMAAVMERSTRTVEVHRYNLMRKWKVRNATQLVEQGVRRGLVSPEAPR